MVPLSRHARLLAVLLVAASTAQAQPAAGADAGRPDPLNPEAAVPALRHDSALAHYRRIGDERPVDWKKANDIVHGVGGWRAYAREAAAPASAPAATKPAGSAR